MKIWLNKMAADSDRAAILASARAIYIYIYIYLYYHIIPYSILSCYVKLYCVILLNFLLDDIRDIEQRLLFWLFKDGFKVSSGTV